MKFSTQRPRDSSEAAGSNASLRARPAQSIRTVIVGTDLSARSDRALGRAVELAKSHTARLVVLHVLDEDLPASVQAGVTAAAKEEIEGCLGQAGDLTGLDVEIKVVPGNGYNDILENAHARGADLIVMGVHRNESGKKSITGTTMERVIRKGKLPVLVVPDRVKGPYEKVMIGVDFSVFSRVAIRGAVALAPSAEFYAVHAFQVPFEAFQPGEGMRQTIRSEHERDLTAMIEEELDSLIGSSVDGQQSGISLQKVVQHGEVPAVLRAEAERLQPDLMVLGTHGRVGLSHALLGSVADDFLNLPPCDVLVVKAW